MTRPAITTGTEPMGVFRMPAEAPIPQGLLGASLTFISRTEEELSIVCRIASAETSGLAAIAEQSSAPWAYFKVEGPLDFSLVGILAEISGALAAAQISLFAVSTYDTDYVLVRSEDLQAATRALGAAGFSLS